MVDDVAIAAVVGVGGLIGVCTVSGVGLHDAVDVFQMLGTITFISKSV